VKLLALAKCADTSFWSSSSSPFSFSSSFSWAQSMSTDRNDVTRKLCGERP
jgi:hypothetical protein